VTSDVKRGEVFLRDDADATYRLTFDGEPGARAVPAGRYRLLGYRLVEGDWMLSATGGKRALELEAGTRLSLQIDPTVRLKLTPRDRAGEQRLDLSLRGEGLGLTIYHRGRRIELPWSASAEGRELAHGSMRYG